MKKYLYFPFIILSMFMALTGCSSDDEELPVPPPVVIKGLTPLASANSWITEATAMQQKGYDPQVMVVYFSLKNLPVAASASDLVGGFVGDQCRYAASVQPFGGDLVGCVVMYRVDADGSNPLSFNIRYYSKQAAGYFTAKPITFETNGTQGTLTDPAHLTWITE